MARESTQWLALLSVRSALQERFQQQREPPQSCLAPFARQANTVKILVHQVKMYAKTAMLESIQAHRAIMLLLRASRVVQGNIRLFQELYQSPHVLIVHRVVFLRRPVPRLVNCARQVFLFACYFLHEIYDCSCAT